MSSRYLAAVLTSLAFFAGVAGAQPEPWLHPDGTIHYYHAIAAPGGITWDSARGSAQDSGGYPATLTSQAENDFVFGLVDSDLYWHERSNRRLAGPWLGGRQRAGALEPDSGWLWFTTDPFDFQNWSPGEPDNAGNENTLHFGESVGVRVSTWDDVSAADDSVRGFVRELSADSTTAGLLQNDSAASIGYTLFAPLPSQYTYLVDNKGRLVHSWRSDHRAGFSAHLLENGRLLRAASIGNPTFRPGGGRVEEFDWDGNRLWFFDYSDSLHCQHHDIEPLPSGNVLMIAWEYKTAAEAIAAGRNPDLMARGALWFDCVIEYDPVADSIVWEWHFWDHLIQDFDSTRSNYGVVADHPELADINFLPSDDPAGELDWNHSNGIDYNEQLDQIMLSVRNFSEVLVIDHGTTTKQARGHSGGRRDMGGDILYRWGNPRVYRAGDSADQSFFAQHDAHWIRAGLPGAGHILVFNNGVGRPGDTAYSTVDEIIPACDSTGAYPRPAPGSPFGPAAQSWIYRADPPEAFFSGVFSGAQREPNGNTLACLGWSGVFVEVTPDSRVVWRYRNPVTDAGPLHQGDSPYGQNSMVFRATCYAPDYPGLNGRSLTPGYPIERYRTSPSGISESGGARNRAAGLHASPNPFGRQTTIHMSPPRSASVRLGIYSADGRLIRTLPTTGSRVIWSGVDDAGSPVGCGVYYCWLQGSASGKPVKLVKEE